MTLRAGQAKREDAAFALSIPRLKDQNLCFTLEAEALLRGLKAVTKVGALLNFLRIRVLPYIARDIVRCALRPNNGLKNLERGHRILG